MNGCVLEEAPIAIDYWTSPQHLNANLVFFLSHLHTDHTKGLTSSWRFHIYTSPINYKLAMAKFEFSEPVLKSLELDVLHELLLSDGSFMNVTLIDANHVPGSVMFLFQGKFGNILYSGDMRYYEKLKYHPQIEYILNGSAIDVLYLDNTFCHPKFTFPSRDEVTLELLELISKYSNYYIKIGVRQIGKEDVLETIANEISELILVYPLRHKQMVLLQRQNIYTTIAGTSRIQAIDLNRITSRSIERENQTSPTIGIILTALYYNCDPSDRNRFSNNIFILPYSDHSSYPELMQLVKELKPRKVKPIVKTSSQKSGFKLPSTSDMSVFNEYLSSPKNSPLNNITVDNSSTLTLVKKDLFGINGINCVSLELSSPSLELSSPTLREVLESGGIFMDDEDIENYEDAVEEIIVDVEKNDLNINDKDELTDINCNMKSMDAYSKCLNYSTRNDQKFMTEDEVILNKEYVCYNEEIVNEDDVEEIIIDGEENNVNINDKNEITDINCNMNSMDVYSKCLNYTTRNDQKLMTEDEVIPNKEYISYNEEIVNEAYSKNTISDTDIFIDIETICEPDIQILTHKRSRTLSLPIERYKSSKIQKKNAAVPFKRKNSNSLKNNLSFRGKLKLIREVKDICSDLLNKSFELKPSQTNKRNRMLELLDQLCN